MQKEIIFAGFGGQGVLLAGQLLSYAAMDNGLEVTWIPSYGPEMRGGTANCTVVISDEEIGSPMVRYPQALVAFNLPSLDKYEKLVQKDGLIILNSSIIPREVERSEVRVVRVPANDIAAELGDNRLTNMVMLGCLIANLPVLPLEAIENALKAHLPQRHAKLQTANIKALHEGAGRLVATA